jgi:hypothetical protein
VDKATGAAEVEDYGHSPRLADALTRLWATMADDYGLVPDLAFDALMARTRFGEGDDVARCMPRLVNLMVDYDLSVAESIEVITLLSTHTWGRFERNLLVEMLDAWWYEVLNRDPGEHHRNYQPDDVLGLLSRTEARMVRWLHVWLAEIDGPAAVHLASALLDGLDGPAWDGQDDARGQVLAWARSETVVNGLALIGTTHIDSDVMSRVLDRLLDNG